MSELSKKARILVVDDMQINLDLMIAVLSGNEEYIVATAQDGKTAIRKAKSTQFDIILLDVMMPEMDGFEVCNILKSYPATKNVPVIFLTALNDPKNIKRAFQSGAVDYISKPFAKEELCERVKLHIQLKRTNEELVRARKEAEAAAEAKSIFLANMSHEIRTPMNGIIGMVDILKHTPLNEEQKEYLSIIESSGENLLTIINDILDYSKIEAGRIELEKIPIKLEQELRRVKSILQVMADRKKLQIKLNIGPEVPEYLLGDPVRLKQIIINLVNNAIKFTEKGEVRIEVEAQKLEDGKATLLFRVVDTGIGISEEGQKRLFRSFSQVDKSTTRKFGGTGLGLAISKNLSEMMGGEIGVISKEGEGSTFWFTVCLEITDAETYQKTAEPEQGGAASGKGSQRSLTILLAEDNKINQRVAMVNLNNLGHQVDIANNGKEALEMFTQKAYDLVFMDIQMPEMDGMEATKKIRELEVQQKVSKKIPIIAMTANTMEGDREKYLQIGMDDYVSKPFKQGELVKIFDKYTV
jgi:signal transduction histidine kinase